MTGTWQGIGTQSLGGVWLFATPWTVDCQSPLSMGFSRQEYWSRLPFPLPGDLPNTGIEPVFLVSPVLASGFFTTESPRSSGKVSGWPRSSFEFFHTNVRKNPIEFWPTQYLTHVISLNPPKKPPEGGNILIFQMMIERQELNSGFLDFRAQILFF